ncbi:uncharacterized protein UBRO2_05069 [Ustilago bromivora]|uniref:Allantoate permease n=1 Tax=Ustilago bromivora TaxID=307758 RepID=A0A8H8TUD6_9BASI|nr:uncharacterized protein UBRO2_05069 [Ustilago bromivora]
MPLSGKEASLSEAHEAGTATTTIHTTSHGTISYTRQEECKLICKVDYLIVPILLVLYLLSFLDHSNIGNAKLDGLVKDINLCDYSTALTMFFISYVIGEVPANIILKKTSLPIWLPSLTLVWGIILVVQGLVQNQAGLFTVCFFLGLSESSQFPGSQHHRSTLAPFGKHDLVCQDDIIFHANVGRTDKHTTELASRRGGTMTKKASQSSLCETF